jgi:hypothetical protein
VIAAVLVVAAGASGAASAGMHHAKSSGTSSLDKS